jgi:sulfite reductase (NADPH) hemoprotein beta-component
MGELSPLGIGNDRDPDGYHTGFHEWVSQVWEALGVSTASTTVNNAAPTDDAIKASSNYLRGRIAEGLLDETTGALYEYDTKLYY